MNGDELPSLVATLQPRIRAFFARRCRDHDDVDDLVQEANASIVRCYHTFAQRSTITTWVYAVCRNVLSNYYYYRERDERLVQKLRLDPPRCDPQPPSALQEVLARLSKDQGRLYDLYYVRGLGVRQVAVTLGRPEGTVKYLLHDLRLHVKRLLEA